jgi:hypothetical protein
MADGGSSSAACNAAGGLDAADNSANANLGSDPGVEEESSGATLARGEPRGEDPSPGSQGDKGHKMHWQLCEVIGAVRASLNVMERCGTSTVHDRIQPTFDAYKLACEQLQTSGEWTTKFTVQQSVVARCIVLRKGQKSADSAVHQRFSEVSRIVRNELMEIYKKTMAFSPETCTYILPSGETADDVLQKMAEELWKSKGGTAAAQGGLMPPDWQYIPLEVFKVFGPVRIGGCGSLERLWLTTT